MEYIHTVGISFGDDCHVAKPSSRHCVLSYPKSVDQGNRARGSARELHQRNGGFNAPTRRTYILQLPTTYSSFAGRRDYYVRTYLRGDWRNQG